MKYKKVHWLLSVICIMTLTVFLMPSNAITQDPSESQVPSHWRWSLSEVASPASSNPSFDPAVAVDAIGNVYVVWDEYTGADIDILYNYRDASTNTWSSMTVISTDSTGDSTNPTLVVDAWGNIHIFWDDLTNYAGSGPDSDIFYKRWDATSNSWTTTEVVSTESTAWSQMPRCDTDIFGNVHAVWMDGTDYDGAGTDGDIFHKYWNAANGTWTNTEVVSTESTAISSSPSIQIGDMGNIHIVWEDVTDYSGAGTDSDVFYRRWDLSQGIWLPTTVLSIESNGLSLDPDLGVDTSGNVHVTWHDKMDYAGSGTDGDIFYKRWNSSLSSWTTAELVSSESPFGSQVPSIGVDTTENIFIAWYDYSNVSGAGYGDYDIFYKVRTKHGPWSDTGIISTESTSNAYDAFFAVGATNDIHVVWMDATNYMFSGPDIDIFYKRFVGVPTQPILEAADPNPNDRGAVYLKWKAAYGASSYSIYRQSTPIDSINGLTPLATTPDTHYFDTNVANGEHFYVVVAGNYIGESAPSANAFVIVDKPTGTTSTDTVTPPLSPYSSPGFLIVGAICILVVGGSIRLRKNIAN